MNCRDWEEKIALYEGGDLSAALVTEVEEHLAECAGCRVIASRIRASMELARSAHEEPIAEGYYTAVRSAVLGQLTEKRNPWWRRMWVHGLAVGVALLIMLVRWRSPEKPTVHLADVRPNQTPILTQPIAPRPEKTSPPRPIRQAPRRVFATVRPLPSPPSLEPLVVKLVTSDPDIVIYWIADRKGEEE
jgi:anti-sigma factor RsiW